MVVALAQQRHEQHARRQQQHHAQHAERAGLHHLPSSPRLLDGGGGSRAASPVGAGCRRRGICGAAAASSITIRACGAQAYGADKGQGHRPPLQRMHLFLEEQVAVHRQAHQAHAAHRLHNGDLQKNGER